MLTPQECGRNIERARRRPASPSPRVAGDLVPLRAIQGGKQRSIGAHHGRFHAPMIGGITAAQRLNPLSSTGGSQAQSAGSIPDTCPIAKAQVREPGRVHRLDHFRVACLRVPSPTRDWRSPLPHGSPPAPGAPSTPRETNQNHGTDQRKRYPRRQDQPPNLIRDEVVGSNPATPTTGTPGQGPLGRGSGRAVKHHPVRGSTKAPPSPIVVTSHWSAPVSRCRHPSTNTSSDRQAPSGHRVLPKDRRDLEGSARPRALLSTGLYTPPPPRGVFRRRRERSSPKRIGLEGK